jgi:Ca2+-binding RTX toxin-like protein
MAWIYGSNVSETINSLDGVTNEADFIYGFGGDDIIFGLGGADTIKGGGGADTINGGSGSDTAEYTDSSERVVVTLGNGAGVGGHGGTAEGDILISIENVKGSQYGDWLVGNTGTNMLTGMDGDDTLDGGSGADSLDGGNGNDTLKGGDGADVLNGGANVDTADYSASAARVIISLADHTASGGDAAGDVLTSIENLIGSNFNDSLVGDDVANVLDGRSGADTLSGLGGNDTFVFHIGQAEGDTVYDFQGIRAGGGDIMMFVGYGTFAEGASFVHVAGNDWQINSAYGGYHELITIYNGATFDPSDLVFI